MADEKDPKSGTPPADDAGKISHDARGNAVWQWASPDPRQALDSTSKMLKRLEVPGLSLLDDLKPDDDRPAVDPVEALKAKRAAGFDPYEGRQKASAASQQKPPPKPPEAGPPASRPAPPLRPQVPPKPVEKPSLLGRLFGKDRDR